MGASDIKRQPVISVRGLHKYYGRSHIIRGVDLAIRPGEVFTLAGPSGAGKSTFLRCLNFLEEPSAGTITVAGIEVDLSLPRNLWESRVSQIRRRAAMVFQDFNLFPHMTVLENMIIGAVSTKKLPREQAVAVAERLLQKAGLSARRAHYPGQLSTGEQQQVAIGRSLCMEPQIILFDDPTSAIDPVLAGRLAQTIRELANSGIAMLIVTNEPALTRTVADQVIFMDDGVWQEITPPHIIFTNPRKERTRRFFEYAVLKDVSPT